MSVVPRDPFQPLGPAVSAALVAAYPSAERLDVCFRLARDLATCEALWRGEPVCHALLDRTELPKAREARLVQLVRPLDLLAA